MSDRKFLTIGFSIVAVLAIVLLIAYSAVAYDKGYGAGQTAFEQGYGGNDAKPLRTIEVLYGRTTYPYVNQAGKTYVESDGYYDAVYKSDTGEHLRYGFVLGSAASRDVVQTGSDRFLISKNGEEYNHTFDNSGTPKTWYMTYLWFSLAGLDGYDRIDDAWLYIQSQAVTTEYAGRFWYARADTVTADYAMLNTTSPTADACRFGFTWNEVDPSASTAWSPALDDRDDWNDWGPRSVGMPDTTIDGSGITYYFNVRDAIQQVKNNGNAGRGIIFIIVGTHLEQNFVMAGGSNSAVAGFGGNPTLVVKATNRSSPEPWGGIRMPVALICDDNKDGDPLIATILRAYNAPFVTASYRNSWEADSENNDAMDSLTTALFPENMDILMHSKTHAAFGTITAAQQADELERDWIVGKGLNNEISAADTLAFRDWVVVGGGVPRYTYDGIRLMANDLGYRSARAAGHLTTSQTGPTTWCAWDDYVNTYHIGSFLASQIFEAASTTEAADICKDRMDEAYNNRRSALILYIHGFDNLTYPGTNLTSVIPFVQNTGYSRMVKYSWLMDRLCSRQRVTLAEAVANGLEAKASADWFDAAGDTAAYRLDEFQDMMFVAPGE